LESLIKDPLAVNEVMIRSIKNRAIPFLYCTDVHWLVRPMKILSLKVDSKTWRMGLA